MLFSVIAYAVLMSHAMLCPVFWTLLDDNCDRTAASVNLCSFLCPPPHDRRHIHGAVSTASASTVQADTVGGQTPTTVQTRGKDAQTRNTDEGRTLAYQEHRRGEETRPTAARTVGGRARMSGNDEWRRGAHPHHRRGDETRVPGTRTGGRDAPNGGRNAWMCGARTAAETCGQGGHTNSTEAERSEGDCELARGPCGTKAVSMG